MIQDTLGQIKKIDLIKISQINSKMLHGCNIKKYGHQAINAIFILCTHNENNSLRQKPQFNFCRGLQWPI